MLTLTVLLLTIGCVIASTIEQRIIGGHHAEDGQFPYQVSLRRVDENNMHSCGGSIISPQWILSAAHCFLKIEPSDIFVVVGSNYLNCGGHRYNISKIIKHKDYGHPGRKRVRNDIAVLRIDGDIQLGDGIKTIALATAPTPGGLSVTLSGWGRTSHTATQSPYDLQYITLTSLTVSECQEILPEEEIQSTHLCTISPVGQGPLMGDSGGPLVYGSQQIGVVSGGICPGGRDDPDIFTRVAAYRDWIKNNTGV